MEAKDIYIIMPNLVGKNIDKDVELELFKAFNNIYNHIKDLYRVVGLDISEVSNLSASSTITKKPEQVERVNNNSAGLVGSAFGQRTIGVDSTDPLIEDIIPSNVIKSDLVITVGAVSVGGKVTLFDGNGKSIEVLTP